MKAKMDHSLFGKKGWTPDRMGDIQEKTYLITGANTGAGFEASRILLSKGATVVMLNRNEKKSAKAIKDLKRLLGDHVKVSSVKMDLADLSSVRQAAKEIMETVPKIDALICNAAVAQVAKQTFTKDGFESQLGIEELKVSQRYLSDTLKKETGKSTTEHLQLYLIGEAKDALLEPSKSIAQVAYELSFEYPQYFSRLFKKNEGISPSDYREKYKLN